MVASQPVLATRRFGRSLAVIAAAAVLVRILYVVWLNQVGDFLIGDALIYHREGQLLAAGEGWISPLVFDAFGVKSQLAMHPPAYPLWLAFWSWLGLDSVVAHQLVTIPIGIATVVMTGLLGRRLAGPAAGLVAAGIAALHPSFWSWEGMLLQEPMGMLAGTLLVAAMLLLLRDQSPRAIVVAGVASGFAPLTRAELGLSVAVAAIVVLVALRSRRAVLSMVGVTVVAILCVLPWAVHNSMRFSRAVPISNGLGITLASTYCSDLTGDRVGYWSFDCAARAREEVIAEFLRERPEVEPLFPGQRAPAVINGVEYTVLGDQLFEELDEAELDARLREHTIEWIRDHPGYVVKSVPIRVARVLGLYRPLQQIRLDEVPDGRKRPIAVGAWLGYFALLPFAVAGAVHLGRRSRSELAVLLSPLVGALAAVALTFGNTRYRAIAEPTIAILAAIGLAVAAAWIRRLWLLPSPPPPHPKS